MKLISFAETEAQIDDESKDVTRRVDVKLYWLKTLKPGDRLKSRRFYARAVA